MPFDPQYVASVLSHNFSDAKALFIRPLLSINYAHLVMLADRGIIDVADARVIRDGLDTIAVAAVRSVSFDASQHEDLFYLVEHLLTASCGENVAGRLHTARSRNDIDMTMYRMRHRECLTDLFDAALALRRSLLDLAATHCDTIFPALTHTQRAQPTTVAHYLLAAIEQLERDAVRLRAAYASINQCPLGACAITGTGFPIDREMTSGLLGFDAPTGNTYGSIATVDYLLEGMAAVTVMLVGLGRLVQDLLLWCTTEFGYLRLSDGFVQSSSIMPQKRNPVALEHARAILSRAVGQAQAVTLAVHNTPFGDIVDTEDDLQPLVAITFVDAMRAVRLLAATVGGVQIDVAVTRERSGQGGMTLTELADHLVKEHRLAFRTAHAISAQLLSSVTAGDTSRLSDRLASASLEVLGRSIHYTDAQLAAILSPEHFVRIRTTPGGPAPSETTRAIAQSRADLTVDSDWLKKVRDGVARSEIWLRERVAAL